MTDKNAQTQALEALRAARDSLSAASFYADVQMCSAAISALESAAPASGFVLMPENEDQAVGMLSVAHAWLSEHAPERLRAAAPSAAEPVERMRHIANEWADMATNGMQWLRNIKEGISTVDDAIENMKSNYAHCRQVNDTPPAPSATLPNGLTEAETSETASVAGLFTPSATSADEIEDQWLDFAQRHANADWNSDKPDGYLNAVKALCLDFLGLVDRSRTSIATLPAAQPEAETSGPSDAQLIAAGEIWTRSVATGNGADFAGMRAVLGAAETSAEKAAGLKDHEIREVISAATKVAKECGHAEQLRERLKDVLLPALRGVVRADAPVAEPVRWEAREFSVEDNAWSGWNAIQHSDLAHYQRKASENPARWQVRPLYTRPPAPEDGKDAALRLKGVNEYGPLLEWSKHWTEFPAGTEFVVKGSAR